MMDNPKYIDLSKLTARLPVLTVNNGDYLVSTEDVAKALSLAAAETGDVVEVVRCMDCKYCRYNAAISYYRCNRREFYSEEVKPTDFCSCGQRKEQT